MTLGFVEIREGNQYIIRRCLRLYLALRSPLWRPIRVGGRHSSAGSEETAARACIRVRRVTQAVEQITSKTINTVKARR